MAHNCIIDLTEDNKSKSSGSQTRGWAKLEKRGGGGG